MTTTLPAAPTPAPLPGPPVPAIPAIPAAPPTTPGKLPPPLDRWSTALGIIVIMLGALSLVMQAASALSLGAMGMAGAFAGRAPSGGGIDQMLTAIKPYQPWILASAAVGSLLALVLVAGGIGLAARRRWSAPTLIGWSLAKIVAVAAACVLNYSMHRDQMAAQWSAMQTSPSLASGPGAAVMTSVVPVVQAVFTLVWGWVLPFFLLIWMRRRKVRADIARWR